MCLHKYKSHGVRARDLGGRFIKGESVCPADQSSGLADAVLSVHLRLYENGEVPHLAARNVYSSSGKQGIYRCTF
jgi:hypothetical protein